MSDKSDPVRVPGRVKWFNDTKGFGFLIVDGINRDCFIHKQQLTRSGIDSLIEDEKVSCVVLEGPKGMYATDVKKLGVT
jgi:cold shock protein